MGGAAVTIGGAELWADAGGALVWPGRETVIVADLHLEKGSAYARRGRMLPPYDSRATLDRLEAVLKRHRPRRIVSLGDGLHDGDAHLRLPGAETVRLRKITAACEWIWISGNHDPRPPEGLGGRGEQVLEMDEIVLRHDPSPDESRCEIAGHMHPKGRVRTRGRTVSRPCFVGDERRLILPAFGAFAGGLNVLDAAFRTLLRPHFRVWLLGRDRLRSFPGIRLEPEPPYPY